mgnify:CR=1 FL=1
MNNKEQPTMQTIISLVKFLVDAWRGSKCPESVEPAYCCAKCKCKELCANIEELAKVVEK